MLSLQQAIGLRVRGRGAPVALFSPSSLFAASEVGVWYDPSDLDTMYQNSTGTTPVTGLEQPVGLILDKSQGLVLGGELDPGFAAYSTLLTGTWAASGGNYVFTDTVGSQSRPGVSWPSLSLPAGWYRIVISVASITGATQIRADGLGASDLLFGTGTHTFTVRVTTTSTPRFRLEDLSTAINDGFALSSVSIKALPGNHAVAANNSTARPVLRSRYNLLTYSEQFDNAAWTTTGLNAVSANSATAPDGTTTADLVSENGVNANHAIYNSIAQPTGTVAFSVYGKIASGTRYLQLRPFGAGTGIAYANYNLSTGAVVSSGGSGLVSTGIDDVGDGWYRCRMVATYSVAPTGSMICLSNGTGEYPSYAGDGTSGIYIWGAQVVANSVFPANTYQRIAAATDYATGADFPPYLAFTTDDAMSTASIDFSGTDEMSVFAGVTKQSDAAFGALTELSASSGGNNGAFGVLLPQSATAGAQFRSRGTANGDAAVTAGYPAPLSLVLTGLGEVSADTSVLRLNGSQAATSANDQGTGNYGNYPLYIGARNNASNFFNGSLYSLIVRGKTSTATEIQSTENYVAGKLGRSITWGYDYLVDDAGNFITTDGGDQIYVAETVTFT